MDLVNVDFPHMPESAGNSGKQIRRNSLWCNTGERLHELRVFFDQAAPEWAVRSFDRELMEELVDRVGLRPGDRVLDLGGGTGHLLPVLRRRIGADGTLCMVDLSPEMLRQAAEPGCEHRALRICGAVEDLPLAGGGWDAAFCVGLYPHLTDCRAALAGIRRVLVAGGKVGVVHLIGREKLNAIHRQIGGTVAEDLLPPGEEVAGVMREAGFRVEEVRDEENCFQVLGRCR